MKELLERIENTNNQIERCVATLGWFLYEVSDLDGNHEEVLIKLLELNPRFARERHSLIDEVFEILNISDTKIEKKVERIDDTNDKDHLHPILETNDISEDSSDELKMGFQFPEHGVIKVFNEPKFKLAICSPDVSDEFRKHAEARKCPIQILDIITQENFVALEQKCREQQAFWNS